MQLGDFRAHPAQLSVEVEERLIEEKRLRLAQDRAPDRNALSLTVGERVRFAIGHGFDPKNAVCVDDGFLDFRLGKFLRFRRGRNFARLRDLD